MAKDSFLSQPITPTITCPACGEMLFYGDTNCRFCHAVINEDHAKKSAAAVAHLTQASRSANIIRSFRNLLYVILALAGLGIFTKNPSLIVTALIISLLNLIGPIRWLKKYGGLITDDADASHAQKDMKLELYFWIGAVLAEAIGLSVFLWKR
ncbi:MAG TPA: hypothetical protein VGW76_16770 [Pyrinomonadaceae bacterium]|nr:hypothetical protein [Pyrinomonadaceae bacterium]